MFLTSSLVLHSAHCYSGLIEFMGWVLVAVGFICAEQLAHEYDCVHELCYPQWALEPQIDINILSVLRYNINRPDCDILLMANCNYHMDIKT